MDDIEIIDVKVFCLKIFQLKSKACLKRQYVHGCSLVRARKFYGYHSLEELFVKIYLYPFFCYSLLIDGL